ncbi:MAG: hypothetical protein ACT443_00850, partial [Gemmatimonadota bacterium]
GWFSYFLFVSGASGIVAGLERGTPGEVYIFSGEETDMNDFAQRVARRAGVKAPGLRLPVFLARAVAPLLDAVSRLTGLRFPITAEAVRTTSVDRWLHKHTRATRDLGYRPRSLNEGLTDTLH